MTTPIGLTEIRQLCPNTAATLEPFQHGTLDRLWADCLRPAQMLALALEVGVDRKIVLGVAASFVRRTLQHCEQGSEARETVSSVLQHVTTWCTATPASETPELPGVSTVVAYRNDRELRALQAASELYFLARYWPFDLPHVEALLSLQRNVFMAVLGEAWPYPPGRALRIELVTQVHASIPVQEVEAAFRARLSGGTQ